MNSDEIRSLSEEYFNSIKYTLPYSSEFLNISFSGDSVYISYLYAGKRGSMVKKISDMQSHIRDLKIYNILYR